MNGSTGTTTVLEAASNHSRPEDKDNFFKNGFVRLPPRTHDISFTDSHISNIERLGADLDAAVKAVWPKRHGIKYSQAHVLLLSWEADDLRVEEEIVGLQHVFRDRFNFKVETYQIPSLKPDKALKRRVLDFLDFDGQDTLLVVYYGGHARRGLHSTDSPIWFANRDNLSISLPSGGIQSMLEEADSDVLLLFDCCHSAAVATKNSLQGKGGVTEVIAACGYETIAAAVDEHSFTKSLTETLAVASKGSPFSVGELHSRVLRKLKCWTPCLERANDGRYIDEPDGRLRLEHQPRRTPIYSNVSESLPRRSIVLAPFPPKPSSPKSHSDSDFENSDSSQADPTPSQSESSTKSSGGKRKRLMPDDGPCAQILLAIRVEQEVSLQAFTDWIRNCPPEAREVHIEGIYDSFSTLILMRIPIALWNLLPQNPAYTFVGFVTSGNQEASFAHSTACECTDSSQCSTCNSSGQPSSLHFTAADQDRNTRSNIESDTENERFPASEKLKGKANTYTNRDQASGKSLSIKSERETNRPSLHHDPVKPTDDSLTTGYVTFSASSSVADHFKMSRNADSQPTRVDKFKTTSIGRVMPEKAAKNAISENAYNGSLAPRQTVLSNSTESKDSSSTTEAQNTEQSNDTGTKSGTNSKAAADMLRPKKMSRKTRWKKNRTPIASGESSSSSKAPCNTPQAALIDEGFQQPQSQDPPRIHQDSQRYNYKNHKYEIIWIWTCCHCSHGGMTTSQDQCQNILPGGCCGHVRCTYCATDSHKIRRGV